MTGRLLHAGLRQRGGAAISIFGLIFVLAGLAVGLYFAKGLVDWMAARSWAPVEARLIQVDLRTSRSSEGDTLYNVEAEYEYDWNGQRFFSSRVGLQSGADNLGDYHHRLHARLTRVFRAGEPVTAWVDPGNPSRAVLDRDMRWGRLGFGLLFPLVFGGFGLGAMVWGRRAGRAQKRRDNRKELHPDEPWMWIDKWRTPEIKSESTTMMWAAIGFAAFWNLVSAPVLFIVPGEVTDGNHVALAALLFPLVGIGLIVWAIRETIRRRRYGDSILHLDLHPVPLGGRLLAALNIPARLAARELQVQLACVNRYVTGSGKHRRTREKVLWEDKQQVMTRSGAGPGQTSAQIGMRVPADQPVSSDDDPRNRMVWRLTATSEEPGVDYKAVFELPVFDTGEAAAAEIGAGERAVAFDAEDWRETGVVHEFAAGGQRFYFPRFRLLGAGLGLLVGALMFAGIGGYMMIGAGHWIFGGIFAAAGLLMLWGAISMTFQRSEIVAGNGRLRWRHGVFGGWHEVDAGALKSIAARRSGSVGSDLYFRIEIERWGREGKTTIAGWVPGQRPASALASRLRDVVGLSG